VRLGSRGVVWPCGHVTEWSLGMVVWSRFERMCGCAAVGPCGRVVVWSCGSVIVWSCGRAVVWSRGFLVERSCVCMVD
jgi:hypothetical protein